MTTVCSRPGRVYTTLGEVGCVLGPWRQMNVCVQMIEVCAISHEGGDLVPGSGRARVYKISMVFVLVQTCTD